MKWFIILACFVAAQFAHGAHVKYVLNEPDSKYIKLNLGKINGTVKSCDITSNKGEKRRVNLSENSSEIPDDISFDYDSYEDYYVTIQKPTNALNGKWMVTVETEEKTTTSWEFYILIKKSFSFPTPEITVKEGQYAIFKFPVEFPKVEVCFLWHKNGSVFDILSEEYSYLRIEEPKACGVRIAVNRTNSYDYWFLYASDTDSNVTYKAQISLSVVKQENLEPKTEYFQLGEKNVIKVDSEYYFKMTYCQLEDPHGKKYPIQAESCSYEIPYVTKFHEGLWKIYYGQEGSIVIMETTKKIIVYDELTSSVNYGENRQINLLCQLKVYRGNIQYCLFTRPDNQTLSITPGVGDERYQHYTENRKQIESDKGSTPPSIYDCGVTIRSPKTEDLGKWKCAIHVGEKVVGTILYVNSFTKSIGSQEPRAKRSKIYVKRGNSFTVTCSTGVVLDYCWMLSPNGTIFSVSKSGTSPTDLTYKGSGLEFGECGAVVEVADDTHQGEWSCRMGALNEPEMVTAVSVTVTDSLLIADQPTIDVSNKNPTIINCRVLPGYDNVINYCRWIRPDGLGIYNKVDNKYVTERTLSTCKLTIQELNVKVDVGSWFCAAGISGRDMKEATTQIDVKYSSMGVGGIISVALGIGLLVITTITLFVIIVRKRRDRQLDEKILPFKS